MFIESTQTGSCIHRINTERLVHNLGKHMSVPSNTPLLRVGGIFKHDHVCRDVHVYVSPPNLSRLGFFKIESPIETRCPIDLLPYFLFVDLYIFMYSKATEGLGAEHEPPEP